MRIRAGMTVKLKNAHIFIEEMCQLYYPGVNDAAPDKRIESGNIALIKKVPGTYLGRPLLVMEIDGLESDFLWVYEEIYNLEEHLEVISESD